MVVAPLALYSRPLTNADLDQMVAIESQVYTDPWTANLLQQSFNAPMTHTLGVFEGGICVAYAIYQVIFTEGHLLNLAVHPDRQRQSLGLRLLRKLLKDSFRRGAEAIFLEVRPSNESARALYDKMGFRSLMVRERYYANGESAVVMVLDLKDVDLQDADLWF